MEKKYKRVPKKTKRIFVAIIPDKNIRDEIRDIQHILKPFSYKLRFTNIEQTHLTLKFLGNDVYPQTVDLIYDELIKHLHNFKPFKIVTKSVQFGFSRQKKPSVVYLEIEQNRSLSALIALIQFIVKKLNKGDTNLKKERLDNTSHITIARVKKDISHSQIRKIQDKLRTYSLKEKIFTVKEIIILESKLTRKGPIYSVYYKIPLSSNN